MGVRLWTLIGRNTLLTLVPALLTLSSCWNWLMVGQAPSVEFTATRAEQQA